MMGFIIGAMLFGGSSAMKTGGMLFAEVYTTSACTIPVLINAGLITQIKGRYKSNITNILTHENYYYLCESYDSLIKKAKKRQKEQDEK